MSRMAPPAAALLDLADSIVEAGINLVKAVRASDDALDWREAVRPAYGSIKKLLDRVSCEAFDQADLHDVWIAIETENHAMRSIGLAIDDMSPVIFDRNGFVARMMRLRQKIDAARAAKRIKRKKTAPRTNNDGLQILTDLQGIILDVLKGKAMTVEMLANLTCAGDTSRLYKPGGLKELRDSGRVCHKRTVGFYRPDAPPSNRVPPKKHTQKKLAKNSP